MEKNIRVVPKIMRQLKNIACIEFILLRWLTHVQKCSKWCIRDIWFLGHFLTHLPHYFWNDPLVSEPTKTSCNSNQSQMLIITRTRRTRWINAQCRSMSINDDKKMYEFGINVRNLIWHWSTLIGIGHWSIMSWSIWTIGWIAITCGYSYKTSPVILQDAPLIIGNFDSVSSLYHWCNFVSNDHWEQRAQCHDSELCKSLCLTLWGPNWAVGLSGLSDVCHVMRKCALRS